MGRIDDPGSIWHCVDCSSPLEYAYMVRDDVWAEAKMGRDDGMLHLACLQKRLGRGLAISDFTKSSLNDLIRFGYRIGVRDGQGLGPYTDPDLKKGAGA